MSLTVRDRKAYRADEENDHHLLDDQEKRRLIGKYVPPPPQEEVKAPKQREQPSTQRKSRLGLRKFLKSQLHLLIYTIMHSIFSLYIKLRKTWHAVSYSVRSVVYYHHRTPELIENDVKNLGRKPKHLSVVLTMEEDGRASELERLVGEAADVAVWSACAGIPMLSIYERSGVLKRYLPQIHQSILQRFAAYYGEDRPGLVVTAPHAEPIESLPTDGFRGADFKELKVIFISYKDGRESMVDLTKTLAEMSQRGKLNPSDIQMDLVDAELSEGIMSEPELLILFGPYVSLSGYPPWQIRLTEIFHLQDGRGVEYQVFIRGLRNFSKAQMRRGK
ncbi:related to NUS1 Putative nuclear undecaprenyl pyrophosphate synthase [Cephalotrichum gorgonifer]|uniref:ditrans,polycis-polyprenyl diphosphate synthase [(2E,6E)-farnesyldiphosphate specific] n=1 Tax=Cephalotrichum gorgonifer TaxID=2041049 RepID=A0AAE8MR86_9PEZI|nr:related to NUS1 Putative nuclear undecaprenyl pyrophosphate synthase [Cephalotrichum gorgonifer]